MHSFQDGQEQSLGPDDFMTMLHEAGANPRLVTEAWLSNCYCRTLWKLAAYEQTYPEQLQGKLLTKDVMLDQLKYRSVAASSTWHGMFEQHQTEVVCCGLSAHSSLLVVGSSMQMYLLEHGHSSNHMLAWWSAYQQAQKRVFGCRATSLKRHTLPSCPQLKSIKQFLAPLQSLNVSLLACLLASAYQAS